MEAFEERVPDRFARRELFLHSGCNVGLAVSLFGRDPSPGVERSSSSKHARVFGLEPMRRLGNRSADADPRDAISWWTTGLSNGRFDGGTGWKLGTGWTISGGTLNNVAGAASVTYQSLAIVAGKKISHQVPTAGPTLESFQAPIHNQIRHFCSDRDATSDTRVNGQAPFLKRWISERPTSC